MTIWDRTNIKIGMDYLIGELGRMPTTTEIDACPRLPSARQLQRRFGGVPAIRKELGYKDVSLDRGIHRSGSSRQMGIEGLDLENRVLGILRKMFGEMCVHEQRRTGVGKQALDFYVYTPDGRFGVDVFKAKNLNSLKNNIRQKRDNYIDYSGKLYLVYESPAYVDPIVDGSVCVLSLAEFLEEVKEYKRYDIQITY